MENHKRIKAEEFFHKPPKNYGCSQAVLLGFKDEFNVTESDKLSLPSTAEAMPPKVAVAHYMLQIFCSKDVALLPCRRSSAPLQALPSVAKSSSAPNTPAWIACVWLTPFSKNVSTKTNNRDIIS